MEVHAKRNSTSSWTTRQLFLMGLVGLIVSASGFTWLVIGRSQFEYQLAQQNAQKIAQLEQRAARYDGHWHYKQSSCLISDLYINNNGLNLVVSIADFVGYKGAESLTFTGEPIAITAVLKSPTDPNASPEYFNVTMVLNNSVGTELKAVVGTTPCILEKTGSWVF